MLNCILNLSGSYDYVFSLCCDLPEQFPLTEAVQPKQRVTLFLFLIQGKCLNLRIGKQKLDSCSTTQTEVKKNILFLTEFFKKNTQYTGCTCTVKHALL